MVAGCNERDTRAHRLDDAGALVSEHTRCVTAGVGATGCVQIRVAHAAGVHLDECFALLRIGDVEILDHEGFAELLENSGAHLHGGVSGSERLQATVPAMEGQQLITATWGLRIGAVPGFSSSHCRAKPLRDPGPSYYTPDQQWGINWAAAKS